MGNSATLILKTDDKALYKKKDNTYIWVVKKGDQIIESPVAVSISKGFYDFRQTDIFLTNSKKDGFNTCQYLEYKQDNMFTFSTVYGIYPVSNNEICKYEIKSENSVINGFNYRIFVIEVGDTQRMIKPKGIVNT